jgi:cellulose synthase/poly-beta-1,6-N-acetylglucosamine synthase-like glycosyltransferase
MSFILYIFLLFVFWSSFFSIIHTYLLYPSLIKFLARFHRDNEMVYSREEDLPKVSILMSVFNEERVIKQKIESIFDTDYPANKIELIIGSDASEDRTVEIINHLKSSFPDIILYAFTSRQGKPKVLNQIYRQVHGEILILTDAKVFFIRDTIFQLVKNFKNPLIGQVAGNLIIPNKNITGISMQEGAFMNREIIMKYNEGKIWGTTMGAYGAIYGLRRELFTEIPEGYSVDDFYITLKVLSNGKFCITELAAKGIESVPDKPMEEFRRKVRISAGNFQNLKEFSGLLWSPFTGLAFSFLSHKVLRWLGPFFLLFAFVSNLLLAILYPTKLYFYLLTVQCVLLVIPFIDTFLRKIDIHVVFLRFITHFYNMNLALFFGFIKFIKGVETNVWQPTKRHQ